jgi:poly-gamma-glutamate capsule biosynthesis protein CapA/YwtB (metallophosphatase superfamily)
MPATVTLALGGDTMLGRLVADALRRRPVETVVAEEVVAALHAADARLLNLECCLSRRGRRWPDPDKPFFFRAPPAEAVALLRLLHVDVVTLANNHALDHGRTALADTWAALDAAGIAHVGAGPDLAAARQPVLLDVAGLRLGIVGVTDHPADFAAAPGRAGVAYADLRRAVPAWLTATVETLTRTADVVVVTPHWGPNLVQAPTPHVHAGADALLAVGAALVAGHSAHVFHGVRWPARPGAAVLYDLGGFVDDYAVHPWMRNDLGLLWTVTLGPAGVDRVEALPLRLRLARTEVARGEDRAWIVHRLRSACAAFGTDVDDDGARLQVGPASAAPGRRLPGGVAPAR